MTLTEVVKARLAEEEELAQGGDQDSPDLTLRLDNDLRWVSVTPARVLLDVEIKRRILADHTDENTDGGPHCHWHGVDDCPTVRDLASTWDFHKDYPEREV